MPRRLTSGQPTARVESMNERAIPAEWHEENGALGDGDSRPTTPGVTEFESRARYRWVRRAALVASVLAAVAASPPTRAMAPGVAGVEPEPILHIEIGDTIKDSSLLRTWILERSLDTTRARIPTRAGHEEWIAVVIGGANYDYRVSVVAMRDGEPLGPADETMTCVCSSDELLALVDERIHAAVEALGTDPKEPAMASPEPAPAPAPTASGAPARPPAPEPSDGEADEPKRLEALGYSGIGVSVLGAAILGAGVALVLRPDEIRGGRGEAERFTTRYLGIAMTAGGGVAVATGVVMIAVDLARPRARRTALIPTFGPRHAGLALTRRF